MRSEFKDRKLRAYMLISFGLDELRLHNSLGKVPEFDVWCKSAECTRLLRIIHATDTTLDPDYREMQCQLRRFLAGGDL
jgi:hypothetical protein